MSEPIFRHSVLDVKAFFAIFVGWQMLEWDLCFLFVLFLLLENDQEVGRTMLGREFGGPFAVCFLLRT